MIKLSTKSSLPLSINNKLFFAKLILTEISFNIFLLIISSSVKYKNSFSPFSFLKKIIYTSSILIIL